MRLKKPAATFPLIETLEREDQRVRLGKAAARLMNQRTGKPARSSPWSLDRQRSAEISAIILRRHGSQGCGDAGELAERYIEAVAPHVLALAGKHGLDDVASLLGWARQHLPALAATRPLPWFRALASSRLERSKANAVGSQLGVTPGERKALNLRTIRAVGMSAAAQRHARRLADREYQRAKREAKATASGKNYTPRESSAAAQARAAGISRATLYRRRARETLSSASNETVSSARISTAETLSSAIPPLGGHILRRDCLSSSDLIGSRREDEQAIGDELAGYVSGPMPKRTAGMFRDMYLAAGLTQDEFADAVGVSRPQIANGLRGRFGFSPDAAGRMKAWLANVRQRVETI